MEKEFTQAKKELACSQKEYQSMIITHRQKQDLQHQLDTIVKQLKIIASHDHAKDKKNQEQRDQWAKLQSDLD